MKAARRLGEGGISNAGLEPAQPSWQFVEHNVVGWPALRPARMSWERMQAVVSLLMLMWTALTPPSPRQAAGCWGGWRMAHALHMQSCMSKPAPTDLLSTGCGDANITHHALIVWTVACKWSPVALIGMAAVRAHVPTGGQVWMTRNLAGGTPWRRRVFQWPNLQSAISQSRAAALPKKSTFKNICILTYFLKCRIAVPVLALEAELGVTGSNPVRDVFL